MELTYQSRSLSLNAFQNEIDLLAPDRAIAVAVLDLDGFSPVNELEGHAAGDAILGRFEALLLDTLPENSLVAHVRGDE